MGISNWFSFTETNPKLNLTLRYISHFYPLQLTRDTFGIRGQNGQGQSLNIYPNYQSSEIWFHHPVRCFQLINIFFLQCKGIL